MKIKKWKLLMAISAVSLLALAGCSGGLNDKQGEEVPEKVEGEEAEEERQFVAMGEQAPPFELRSLEGETYKLEELRGRPVLLNFYSKDCRFCIDKFPELNKLYDQNRDWAEIMAINVGEPAGYSEDLREEYGLNFPILLDENLDTSISYMVRSVPFTVIIDAEGLVREMRVGPMDYDEMLDQLERAKK